MAAAPAPAQLTPKRQALKDAGDALFREKDYEGALKKYDAAILLVERAELHPGVENAVLYSNKAACELALKRWRSAVGFASIAGDMDPSWFKPWVRAACALKELGELPGAHMTFQTAIDCINGDASLDRATKAQHVRTCTQHQREICAVARQNTTLRDIAFVAVQDHSMDYQSCKRIVHAAFLEIAHAQMQAFQTRVRDAPRPAGKGERQVDFARDTPEYLWEAILFDERVLHHIPRGESFEHLVACGLVESITIGIEPSWRGTKKVADVIRDVSVMVTVKPDIWGLATHTIQALIRELVVVGVIDMRDKQWTRAHERFARALELLRWGRDRWDQGPYEDKAPIFQRKPVIQHSNTISRLWLHSYMQARAHVPHFAVPLESFLACAQALEDDVTARVRESISATMDLDELDDLLRDEYYSSPRFEDTTWYMRDTRVPIAAVREAYGYYHEQQAKTKIGDASDPHWRLARERYDSAARMYSNDDERHLTCLKKSLACTRAGGGNEADVRRLTAAIQRATPEVERLWGKTSLT